MQLEVDKLAKKQKYMIILTLSIIFIYVQNMYGFAYAILGILILRMILNFIYYHYSIKYVIMLLILSFFSFSFSITSQIIIGEYSLSYIIMLMLGPVGLFSFGYNEIFVKSEKIINLTLSTLVISLFMFSFLAYINTISTFGNLDLARLSFGGQRILLTFWSNSPLTATGINAYLSLSLSLFPMVFIKQKNKHNYFFLKSLFVIVGLISTYIILQLGNRTGIVLIVGSILFYILYNTKSINSVIRILSITIILSLILYIFYHNNVFGIKDITEGSVLYRRFQTSELAQDSRFLAWKEVIFEMWKYPVGGRRISLTLKYAHNLWLDIVYDAGFLPLILNLLYTGFSSFELWKLLKNKTLSLFTKNLFLLVHSGFILTFFIEPILQGWILYYTIYCFFVGLILKVNEVNKEVK